MAPFAASRIGAANTPSAYTSNPSWPAGSTVITGAARTQTAAATQSASKARRVLLNVLFVIRLPHRSQTQAEVRRRRVIRISFCLRLSTFRPSTLDLRPSTFDLRLSPCALRPSPFDLRLSTLDSRLSTLDL